MTTFLEQCFLGKINVNEVDNFIDCWHNNITDQSLNDFLGMTHEEYALWVENPDMLIHIVYARRNSISINKINKPSLILATKGHKGQFRKYTKEPYIVHPVAVEKLVMESLGKNDDFTLSVMSDAAYLHDVIEDCPSITEQDIFNCTNQNVLTLVKELTNPSKSSQLPRHVRKQMDREHLRCVSWEAKFIKLCDRICNLQDLQSQCPDKNFIKIYREESQLLLSALIGTDSVLENKLFVAIDNLKVFEKFNHNQD